jgi:uncharacterized protein (TIGR00251 family)
LSGAKPWKVSAGGLLLSVRATPKGGRDSVDGIEMLSDGQCVLKVRVRAVPADGEANEALRKLLAKAAGIPASSITIVQGETARRKTFQLSGNAGEIAARLKQAAFQKSKKG